MLKYDTKKWTHVVATVEKCGAPFNTNDTKQTANIPTVNIPTANIPTVNIPTVNIPTVIIPTVKSIERQHAGIFSELGFRVGLDQIP